ncbi:MAG: HD domain-containing protein [Solirubrobacteraceae bacterium]
MVSPTYRRPDVDIPAADQTTDPETATLTDLATDEQTPSLIRSALAFAAVHHAGQRRDSNGAAFIEHPIEVAQLLHDAGCSHVVVAAGLLHDTVEDTEVSVTKLRRHFGADVATLVHAVSEDASIPNYRERKQVLREQVRNAGEDAALLFAADKISKVGELPDQIKRDQARLDATTPGHPTRTRIERSYQLRLEHYHKSLRMLQDLTPQHPLVTRLATALADYRTAHRRGVPATPRGPRQPDAPSG